MASRMGLIGCLIAVVALLKFSFATVSSAGFYEVGDSFGWNVPPNTSYYSDWATTKTFFLGDQFSFKGNGTHNFADVSKADYDNCTKVLSTYGSPVIYIPQSTGSHYMICTVDDHCERGQKVVLTILTPGFTVGSPDKPPVSSASSLTAGALFAVLVSTAVITISLLTNI